MDHEKQDEESFLHVEPRPDTLFEAEKDSEDTDTPLLYTRPSRFAKWTKHLPAWSSWRIPVAKGRRRWRLWVFVPVFISLLTITIWALLERDTATRLASKVSTGFSQATNKVSDAWSHASIPKVSWDDVLPHRLGLGQNTYTNLEEFTNIDVGHACSSIPDDVRQRLDQANKPTIQVVSGGQLINQKTKDLNASISVCILIAVPQKEFRNGSYPDAPVPGKGPDSIHMVLNSTDVIVSFPPLLPLPGQEEAIAKSYHPGNIIYYAETRIMTAGTYTVQADIEFSSWLWTQELHLGPNLTIFTKTGEDPGDYGGDHGYHPKYIPHYNITVGGPRHLPARPPCDNETSAGEGRWYRYQSFPVMDRTLVDEWGYGWQGDQCHMDTYSPIDTLDCMEGKTVHLFGDSMCRRLGKTLMSGGKWCLDPWDKCQDEDDQWGGTIPKIDVDEYGGIVINEVERGGHWERYDDSPLYFGKNTSLYFNFVTALAGSSGTWMSSLFDEEDRFLMDGAGTELAPDAMDFKPGAIPRPPPAMPKADLVILGFGAWDQAFTDQFDFYEEQLYRFRDAFLQAYPDTPIILRLANQFCCRQTVEMFRRYTGGRIQEFDARTRKVFRVEGATAMDGRIMVVDPQMMNGRADVIHDYHFSKANHPRASHVRVEGQMILNSLCKRNKEGKAEWNGYVPGV